MPLERFEQSLRSPSKKRDADEPPPRASRVEITWSVPAIEGVPPCARGGHSTVLADTHLLVFGGHYFGGAGAFAYLNDLHRLDLTTSTWYEIVFREQDAVRPKPRYNHSALLLNGGTRMFVFGGRGETLRQAQVLRDMFFFDLLAMEWLQVQWTTESPAARFGHSCASVDDVRMVLFGGWDGKKSMNDLWVFDSNTFTWLKPRCSGKAPAPRQNHSMLPVGSFGPEGQTPSSSSSTSSSAAATTLIVYGGYSVLPDALPVYNKDVYLFDVESLAWSRPRLVGEYPPGTFGQGMCVHASEMAFVLGGWSGTERSPLYMGDKQVREFASMAAREERLASGQESRGGKKAQTRQLKTASAYARVLDLPSMTWFRPAAHGVAVANRYGHSCTLVGPHVFLFGGWDGNRALSQLVVGELTIG
ncbi:hypothetical protein PybrP1_000941 [[Pythium] brassicae (nom. inval.)]|nr:hypothetical protein PybrP1_000941 [[Pythium] brassicae (nom. inval.)]